MQSDLEQNFEKESFVQSEGKNSHLVFQMGESFWSNLPVSCFLEAADALRNLMQTFTKRLTEKGSALFSYYVYPIFLHFRNLCKRKACFTVESSFYYSS